MTQAVQKRFSSHSGLWSLLAGGLLLLGAECFGEVDFQHEVFPIFAKRCLECHGPKQQKAKLRLDEKDSVFNKRGKSSDPAVIAGNREQSLLLKVIASKDPDEVMPPRGSPLTPQEQELIGRWVQEGARWPEKLEPYVHWSYRPLKRPIVPKIARGEVQNEIDAFIQAKLKGHPLTPAPPAQKEILLRRLSLDLTGLPPTAGEVEAFLKDTRPDAYERWVDRLLGSPQYGERMARIWLDLARYADSHGYHVDSARTIWPYRDWVIRSFNDNVPFDQFTIEQLAGDLLPNPTTNQLIATGFHRNSMVNQECGNDPEEFRVAGVIDRVNTTATVWLGATMACAQCHDHKYDPFSQKEYFQFYAFFNNTTDKGSGSVAQPRTGMDNYIDQTPILHLPNEKDAEKLAEIRSALAQLKGNGGAQTNEVAKLEKSEKELLAKVPSTLILKELEKPRQTRIQIRGNFLDLGEEVHPEVPKVFPPMPPEFPRNRLGLARWLVSPENPVPARVVANRLWEQFFGRGLVDTMEDFGSQGSEPTHPELLNWLASEFMAQGWNIKKIQRLLVTSSTYRQSSGMSEQAREIDPLNKLYARGPRFRLEAEMVRDNVLAVSGLLNRKMGGPSAYPYQPAGLWSEIGIGRVSGEWKYGTEADRHRRGLYTFMRRSIPYPAALTFDAPTRQTCTAARPRTNTPLQALITLNDPVYFEAAQAFGKRIMNEGGSDAKQRVEFAFKTCLARRPTEAERQELLGFYTTQLQRLKSLPEQARKIVGSFGSSGVDPAELAAWIMAGNVLLNLDETITKG